MGHEWGTSLPVATAWCQTPQGYSEHLTEGHDMHIIVNLSGGDFVEYPSAKDYSLNENGLLKVYETDGGIVAFSPGGYSYAELPKKESNVRIL